MGASGFARGPRIGCSSSSCSPRGCSRGARGPSVIARFSSCARRTGCSGSCSIAGPPVQLVGGRQS
eukprot:6571597-Lingulodinium_polyedra.AAC.1